MSSLGLELVCFLLVYSVSLTAASDHDFTRIPESQTVGLGLDAVFHCQHRGALSIGWLVNGVPLNRLNDSGMFVKSGNYRDQDNSLVYTLTILARPEYNETMVECVATFLDGPAQRSPPVTLTIEDTCGSLTITTTFTIIPMLGVFADGSEAKFRCHHLRSNRIMFEIDGLSLNDSMVEDASVVQVPAGDGRSVFVLTFEADQIFDGSMIVCVADFTNGCPSQETFPALLLIQGPLSAVTLFRRITSSNPFVYSWTPPPTLDLTDVSPDVVYSIEVYNITCGADDLLGALNNLTVSLYQNALLDPGHVYKVLIVPRSNVQGARNGTTFTKYERFGEMNMSSTVLMENSSGVAVEFDLQSSVDTDIRARWYSVLIRSLDLDKAEMPIVLDMDAARLRAHHVLPRRQLWSVSAVAYDCEEHQVANTTISTHDVQDVTVMPTPGGIIVTGYFIDKSGAVGVLLIVFSLMNEDGIRYMFVPRPRESQDIETTLTGLSEGDYQVSFFVVDEGGLPFNRSANLPRNISIVSEKEDTMKEQSDIYFELEPTSTGVCITCTFPKNSSITHCVAVVHQQISQLSSSGLMNIESSHKFTRSGDSAYGCIEGVNLEQFQVGVVGGRQSTPGPSEGPVHSPNDSANLEIIISVPVAIIGSISILSVIITIILLCKRFGKRKKSITRRQNANNVRGYQGFNQPNSPVRPPAAAFGNSSVNIALGKDGSVSYKADKSAASALPLDLKRGDDDDKNAENYPLLRNETNSGHNMSDKQGASSKGQSLSKTASTVSPSNIGDSSGVTVPEQRKKETVSSQLVTQGNRPESKELVTGTTTTTNRRLSVHGVNSADKQLKPIVTTTSTQPENPKASSLHDPAVYVDGANKRPTIPTTTTPADSDELSANVTGESSSLSPSEMTASTDNDEKSADKPVTPPQNELPANVTGGSSSLSPSEMTTSTDNDEKSADKPVTPPQNEDTFKSNRPHRVSRHGHDPHIAVARPTINSDDPPSQSQPAEAAIKFVAENKGEQNFPESEEPSFPTPSEETGN